MLDINKIQTFRLRIKSLQIYTIYNIFALRDLWEGLLESILVYNRYSEQSVCNLFKKSTLPLVFSRGTFDNGYLWKAASEQCEKAACNIIRFLTLKNSFGFLLYVRLHKYSYYIISKNNRVRTYTLYRLSVNMRSLKIPAPRNFNNLIRQNQKLGSDSDLNQSATVSRVQSPGPSAQSPASLVQRPTLAPRAQEFRYAQKNLKIS